MWGCSRTLLEAVFFLEGGKNERKEKRVFFFSGLFSSHFKMNSGCMTGRPQMVRCTKGDSRSLCFTDDWRALWKHAFYTSVPLLSHHDEKGSFASKTKYRCLLAVSNWSPEIIVKALSKGTTENFVWKYVSVRVRFMWRALKRNQKLNKSEDGGKVQGQGCHNKRQHFSLYCTLFMML